MEEVTIKKDGDSWVAYRKGFVNLQESLAGFGDSEMEALKALLLEELGITEQDIAETMPDKVF